MKWAALYRKPFSIVRDSSCWFVLHEGLFDWIQLACEINLTKKTKVTYSLGQLFPPVSFVWLPDRDFAQYMYASSHLTNQSMCMCSMFMEHLWWIWSVLIIHRDIQTTIHDEQPTHPSRSLSRTMIIDAAASDSIRGPLKNLWRLPEIPQANFWGSPNVNNGKPEIFCCSRLPCYGYNESLSQRCTCSYMYMCM